MKLPFARSYKVRTRFPKICTSSNVASRNRDRYSKLDIASPGQRMVLSFKVEISASCCTLIEHAIFSLKRPGDLYAAGAYGKV